MHGDGGARELLLHRVLSAPVPRHPISGYVDWVCMVMFGFFLGSYRDVGGGGGSSLPLFLIIYSLSPSFFQVS